MKKQHSSESAPLENHLKQFTDDSPLMEWLQKQGKNLLIGLLIFIALLFIAYRMSSLGNARTEADYSEAAQQFTLFQKSNDKDAYDKLQVILNRNPELHPKYDGQLAQLLINRDDPQGAQAFAALVFDRVRNDDVPYYEEFGAITLLISKGDYSTALERSKNLKQKLLKDASNTQQDRVFGDLLFAYNLLRIAMLEQKAGTKEGEQTAWSEWKSYTTASTNSASIKAAPFYTLDSLFGEGQLTLNNYIKSRQENAH